MTPLEKKIAKAKLELMVAPNTMFFSSLLANLRLIETEDIPTAATDGISLFYNPKFFGDFSTKEALAVLLHEVFHVALEHITRCKEKNLNKVRYNIAGDYYINNWLDSHGYDLPGKPFLDHKYDGWSTQQIYDDLPDDIGQTFICDVLDTPEGMSEAEHKETVISNVVKAVTQAELSGQPGSVPGEVMRRIKDFLNPKLPWTVILQNHLSVYAKDDYSWRKPNRRMWPDVYLPSLHSESLDLVTVGVDVSGSISQESIDEFLAEVRYIWETLNPKKLRFMAFDTEVRKDVTLEPGDTIDDLEFYGGGGTSLSYVLDAIREQEPEFALIFSDFEVAMPYLEDITSDLFWIQVGDQPWNPSRGEVIQLK